MPVMRRCCDGQPKKRSAMRPSALAQVAAPARRTRRVRQRRRRSHRAAAPKAPRWRRARPRRPRISGRESSGPASAKNRLPARASRLSSVRSLDARIVRAALAMPSSSHSECGAHCAFVRLHQRRRRHVLQIIRRHVHQAQRAGHHAGEHRRGHVAALVQVRPLGSSITTTVANLGCDAGTRPANTAMIAVGGIAAGDGFVGGAGLARDAIADERGLRARCRPSAPRAPSAAISVAGHLGVEHPLARPPAPRRARR